MSESVAEPFDQRDSERIAKNIRAARQRRGWDAAELARRIRERGERASHSSIQKLERGWMRLHPEWVRKIAAALDVTPADLHHPQPTPERAADIPVLTWPEIVTGRPGPGRKSAEAASIDDPSEPIAVHARERDRLDEPVNVRPGDLLILVPGRRARSALLIVAGPDGVPQLAAAPVHDPVMAAVIEVRKPVPAASDDLT